MHHFAKTQTTHNCCSKRSILFCELSITTTDPWHQRLLESFQLFKTNEPRKFRGVAFVPKCKSFQSSNATWAIFWSKLATTLLQPVIHCVVEMQTRFLSGKQIFTSASLEHHLMTVLTILSQQNISTDDNLLTHSALLHTIPLWSFILF